MAVKQRLLVVNFGAGKGGLTTIGYAIYTSAGAVSQARSTAGVVEIGSSTGIYAAPISLAEGFEGIVLWDTGDATVRYGVQETLSQLNNIQDETDHIRIIWNSLRNQGTLYQQLLERLDRVKGLKPPKEYDKALEKIMALLADIEKKPEPPSLPEIRQALKVTVPAPDVHVPTPVVNLPAPVVNLPAPVIQIPETVIPDYTGELQAIRSAIKSLVIPSEQRLLDAVRAVERIAQDVNGSLSRRATAGEVRDGVRQIREHLTSVVQELLQIARDRVDLDKVDALLNRMERLGTERRSRDMMRTLAS